MNTFFIMYVIAVQGVRYFYVKYLLDTNVLSEPIRPKPNQQILNKLEQHQDELATATLVWHELLFGCQRLPVSRKRKILEQYLYETVTQMPILYIQEAAEWHAQERARLSLNGKMLKAKLRLIIALFICLL